MVSETPHYTLSQDYERMRELLDAGPLLGFIDFELGGELRDPVRIQKRRAAYKKNNYTFAYCVGVRGCGYIEVWDDVCGWDEFVNQCRMYRLSYIVPNSEVINAD